MVATIGGGAFLREARENAGLTQGVLAEALGHTAACAFARSKVARVGYRKSNAPLLRR